MKRCVIVGGAGINDYDRVRGYLREDDYFIYCDCGLRHADGLGFPPDLIVGDFDSYTAERPDAETIILPCEKDDTDTVYAVKEALKRGFEDFLIIGGVGARLDHSLGNVSILSMLHGLDKKALLVDDYSEMEVVSREPVYIDESFPYFSLLAVFGTAEGVYIENAKYPLENAVITCDYQYGISNEVPKGKIACVRVENGSLLLIRVKE